MTPELKAAASAEARRVVVSIFCRLRAYAIEDHREAITVDDLDRLEVEIAEERINAMAAENQVPVAVRRAQFADLPDDDDPTGHGAFDPEPSVAGTVTDAKGMVVGEIVRHYVSEQYAVRFLPDVLPPVPTVASNGAHWWGDAAGIVSAKSPRIVRDKWEEQARRDAEEVRKDV